MTLLGVWVAVVHYIWQLLSFQISRFLSIMFGSHGVENLEFFLSHSLSVSIKKVNNIRTHFILFLSEN